MLLAGRVTTKKKANWIRMETTLNRARKDTRILIYSHDTFGLGHLRRCRTIAHSLVEDYRGVNILIISGATIAGAVDATSPFRSQQSEIVVDVKPLESTD